MLIKIIKDLNPEKFGHQFTYKKHPSSSEGLTVPV